jgi:hypothetical protein
VVSAGDFFDGTNYYDVTLEVKDNVATKRVREIPAPLAGINYIVKPIKNILNPDNVLIDYQVHPDTGLPYSTIHLNMWQGIKVKPDTDYAFTDVYGIAWFDSSGTLIKYETSVETIKSPTNAAIANFDCAKAQFTTAQVEEGTSRTSYEPYSDVVIIENLDAYSKDEADAKFVNKQNLTPINYVFPLGLNILNPDGVIVSKFINPETKLPYDASWAKLFFQRRIKPSTDYSITGNYQILLYDKDLNPIGDVYSPNNHFTTPSNAAFISVDAPVENNVILAEGTIYPLVYEPFIGKSGVVVENLIINEISQNEEKITIGDAEANEIIIGRTRMYYQNPTQGIFFGGGAGGEVIPDIQANTAWGKNALSSVTTGGSNTAFGLNALKSLTTGWDNTAFGSGALESFQDGVGNQAMGRLALSKLVNGGHNTALTDSALEKMEAGEDNTSVGYGSGTRIIVGNRNTIYGVYSSGWNGGGNATQQTNYDDTVAFGAFTLNFNTSGSKNTTGGNYSMYKLTGESNAAWGYFAMYGSNNSSYNACFGNYSGQKLVNGNNNVFVGHEAGGKTGQKTDAVGTTVIGSGAISTRDNEVVIGKSTDTHVTIAGVEFTKAQLQALKNLVS